MAKDVRSSDVKDLESRGSAAGTELIPAELNGRDVYLTAQQIADLGVSGGEVISVDGRSGVVTLSDLYDASGAAASAQAASQPLDADLTAIAALTTQTFGRSLLTASTVAALQTITGKGIYYASNYGVLSDGVTDDTTNLQAAITAVNAAKGGDLYMPPGVCLVSATLILYGGVRIHGSSVNQSYIQLAAGSNCDMFQPGGTSNDALGGLFDIQLYGNRDNQTAGTVNHGINMGVATTLVDSHYRFRNVAIQGFTGHGFNGGSVSAGGHILTEMYSHHNGGNGIYASYDTEVANSWVAFNDLAGVFSFGYDMLSNMRSYNNGRAAWWDGTAVTYSGASAYNIGNGVIGSDGVVYVANNAIAAGIANPKTTWDSQGDATWIKLDKHTRIVYSSDVSTVALATSTATYYCVTAAGGVVDTMTNSLAGTPTVVSLAASIPRVLPNAPGFHFYGTRGHEIACASLDANQNAGSGFYYQASTTGGNTLNGTVQSPNSIATTGVVRTKNPNQNAGITIDNSKGIAATLGCSRMNAGDAAAGGGVQDANSAPVFYAASSPTLNNLNLVTDGSGVVPIASNIGSTNLVTYNGTQLGVPLTSAHLLVGNGSGVATDVALSGDVTITNAGVATVGQINGVAYSGDPLTQYALLAGRSGGQTVKGDTASGGNLTLNSTANATKGKILLGASSGYDEVNLRLGIGTQSPTSIIHAFPVTPASVGTTPGTAAASLFTGAGGSGATGGLTSIATTGVGGTGANYGFTGTPGGTALSAVTSSTGGKGGTITIITGAGGVGGATAGSTTAVGGAAGDVNATGGTGGAVSSANATATGGGGGQILFVGGNGGAESNSTAAGAGGNGGQCAFTAGTGGASATGAGTHTGGNGGSISFIAGPAGTGSSANGTPGSILFKASSGTGAAATILTINNNGTNPLLTLADTTNIVLSATTGTIIGTATTQKLAFYNSTPIVQPSSTTDLRTALINLGLYATGGASPLNLNGGALTVGTSALTDTVTITDAKNIVVGSTTGTKIGTATSQKLGFYNAAPVVQQTQGATLTNNVTAGGSANTLANFTDLTLYANDSAAIRNDIYQIGQTLKTVVDALRTYGLLS